MIKSILASIGLVTVLVLLAVGLWQYRGQVGRAYRSVVDGQDSAGAVSVVDPTGTPSSGALRSAESKERRIGRGGSASVRLTPDEMASIVQDRLDPLARRALDSLKVTLEEERFTLEGQVLVAVFGRDLLGPLVQILGERQPIRVSGPVALRDTGVVAWACDEFVIAGFPFPQAAIPSLVDQLTGMDEGAFLIPVPESVGEVSVAPDGVTFYRWMD